MYKIVFVISAKGIPLGERREKSEYSSCIRFLTPMNRGFEMTLFDYHNLENKL